MGSAPKEILSAEEESIAMQVPTVWGQQDSLPHYLAFFHSFNMVEDGTRVNKRFEVWRGRFAYMREERTRRVSVMQKRLQASGTPGLIVPSDAGDRESGVGNWGVPLAEDQMTEVTDVSAATKFTNEDEGDYEENVKDARVYPTARVEISCKDSDETF